MTTAALFVMLFVFMLTGAPIAVSLGLSRVFADDHEMLAHGMVIYDALHTWCRQAERAP